MPPQNRVDTTQIESGRGDGVAEGRAVEFDVESRLQLSFEAAAGDIEPLFGPGWISESIAEGPSRGANLNLTFRIRHLTTFIGTDLEESPGERDIGALITASVRRKATGERASYVLRSFSANKLSLPGPYRNSVSASVTRRQAYAFDESGKMQCEDEWHMSLSDGQALDLRLTYETSPISTVHSKITVYGGPDHGFHRQYALEKGAELIMSRPDRVDRTSRYELRSSVRGLERLLDADRCVSVAAEPWYKRYVFVAGAHTSNERDGGGRK
jgi:hypothetical protein